jgi:hypothetical protein
MGWMSRKGELGWKHEKKWGQEDGRIKERGGWILRGNIENNSGWLKSEYGD